MNIDVGRVGIWSSSSAWEHARDLADAAAELEELGYGALWLGSSRGDMELPSTLLASTRRLVVATAIIDIRTNPAQQLACATPSSRRERLTGSWLGSAQATCWTRLTTSPATHSRGTGGACSPQGCGRRSERGEPLRQSAAWWRR